MPKFTRKHHQRTLVETSEQDHVFELALADTKKIIRCTDATPRSHEHPLLGGKGVVNLQVDSCLSNVIIVHTRARSMCTMHDRIFTEHRGGQGGLIARDIRSMKSIHVFGTMAVR